jgi:hypothetical protein
MKTSNLVRHGILLGFAHLLLGLVLAGTSVQASSPARSRITAERTSSFQPHEAIPGRHRIITINPEVLNLPSFDVHLFGGDVLRLVRERFSRSPNGDRVWVGKIQGEPLSRATFTLHRGVLSGVIDRVMENGNELYEIQPDGAGRYHLFQHRRSGRPVPLEPEVLTPEDDSPTNPPTGGESSTSSPDDTSTVDLLIVYSTASRVRYGQAGIEAKIMQAVADANSGMINSLVPVNYSLVHMAEVNYVETGSMSAALMALQRTADGIVDEVHALRDQYGADVVVMINEDTSAAGISYLMSFPSPTFASNAFAVVYSGALAGLSLSHELGHIFGVHHNRENASGTPAYPYGYGWRSCTGTTLFRTIMSYSCGSAPRVNYFSNPNLSFGGIPMGVDPDVDPANGADNARAITQTAAIVAAFRATAPVPPPAAPSGLSATDSSTQISLAWTDQSSNETSFRIERSVDGGAYTVLASVVANTSSFVDAAVTTGSTYSYVVFAVNPAGDSAASNVATATVPSGPPAAPSSLSGVAVSRTQINLSWTDNSTNETGFVVQRSTNGFTWTQVGNLGANATSFSSTGLRRNTLYYYRVRSFNASGSSAFTPTIAVRTRN